MQFWRSSWYSMMMNIAALDIEALASFAKKSHHNIIQNPNLVDIDFLFRNANTTQSKPLPKSNQQ